MIRALIVAALGFLGVVFAVQHLKAENTGKPSVDTSVLEEVQADLVEVVPRPPDAPTGIIECCSDAIGAYMFMEDGGALTRVKIVEMVWGITADGTVGLAIMRSVDEEGRVVDDWNKPELYERIAFNTEELVGSHYLMRDGSRIRIDEVNYWIDPDGLLGPGVWKGTKEDGTSFLVDYSAGVYYSSQDEMSDPVPFCCVAHSVERCVPSPTCTGECPGPTNCACTANGSCAKVTGPQCMGSCTAPCPHQGNTCLGPPPNCECRNN